MLLFLWSMWGTIISASLWLEGRGSRFPLVASERTQCGVGRFRVRTNYTLLILKFSQTILLHIWKLFSLK